MKSPLFSGRILSLALTCSVFTIIVPTTSMAWGGDGHIQVADIAWTKLTPKSREKLTAILNAGEPRFRNVNARQAWRDASNFADFIKGNTKTIYDAIIPEMNRYFDKNIESIGNEGVKCKTWHYLDIPIRYKGEKPKIDESNAYNALELAQKELAKGGDLMMQCWWAYWINHIVGDLHQPLHCVSSFEHHDDGDAGGNKFEITAPDRDRKVRLHGFWDGGIGLAIKQDREAGLSPNVEDVSERWSKDPTLVPSVADQKNLDVMSWIERGAKLADEFVYDGLKPLDKPNEKYLADQILLSKKQAVLAGFRLAEMMNRILDPQK